MGQVTGDFDNDGRLDWYVTSVHGTGGYDVPWDAPAVPGTGNMLYRNRGGHRYEQLAGAAGVDDGGWGWGAVAVDLDHDGDQDLVTTNGWADLNAAGRYEWLHERTYLFRNELQPAGGLGFTEVGSAAGLDHAGQGRGLINLDYDNDGDQDLVIFDSLGPISLYRNDLAGPDTHWLRLFLDTSGIPGLAPNGRGARVELTAGGGRQYRYPRRRLHLSRLGGAVGPLRPRPPPRCPAGAGQVARRPRHGMERHPRRPRPVPAPERRGAPVRSKAWRHRKLTSARRCKAWDTAVDCVPEKVGRRLGDSAGLRRSLRTPPLSRRLSSRRDTAN